MDSVQIRDKKKRIAIKNGDKVIGEITFNPDNTEMYSKFLDILNVLAAGSKKIKDIKVDDSLIDKKMETIEDFENASEVFGKIKQGLVLSDDLWKETCKNLDDLFGKGVCEYFTQGDSDVELLEPLFEVVTPFFEKARTEKVDKYKRQKLAGHK